MYGGAGRSDWFGGMIRRLEIPGALAQQLVEPHLSLIVSLYEMYKVIRKVLLD